MNYLEDAMEDAHKILMQFIKDEGERIYQEAMRMEPITTYSAKPVVDDSKIVDGTLVQPITDTTRLIGNENA